MHIYPDEKLLYLEGLDPTQECVFPQVEAFDAEVIADDFLKRCERAEINRASREQKFACS